jgi:hypothetical protein
MSTTIEKERRARRRRSTSKVSNHRRKEHLHLYHREDVGDVTCDCKTREPGRRLGCSCRKRHKGRPKTSNGLCKMGSRDRIYARRRQIRKLKTLILTRHLSPWEDEVALVDNPTFAHEIW